MEAEDQVLAWLGLAIAVVVLNDFGLGTYARYTLLAVIAYGVLVNIERIDDLLRRRFLPGLSLAR